MAGRRVAPPENYRWDIKKFLGGNNAAPSGEQRAIGIASPRALQPAKTKQHAPIPAEIPSSSSDIL